MSELYQDLLKDVSESFEDGNYFLVTITELELEQEYPVEFRWKFKDGSFGQWGPVKTLNSQAKTTPTAPNLDSADVEGGAGFIKVSWGGFAGGVTATDFDRVNIYISGGSFGDGTKPAGFFKKAETRTFPADPGIYIIILKIQTVNGAESSASISRSVTVKPIEEQVQAPIVPIGFTAEPKLGGLEITWSGGYTGGASWYGFQGINIYAGTSASLTPGTYIKVGQLTANKVENKTFLPVDGTYVRYDNIAYIHASSVNRATPPVESSISANVANATPRRVVNTDIIDAAITEAKIAINAVTEVKINNAAITEAKIATSAITETKIASDAITTPKIAAGAILAGKIAAGAITTEKLDALAITSDKIAANAITAVKIAAGEINASKIAALTITGDKIAANTIAVGKLEANTISVANLEAGDIKASSFIRAGAAGNSRVELAGSATSGVPAGLHIYNGTNPLAVLAAPLGGGLTIRGSLVATEISTSSGKFTVDTNGIFKSLGGFIGSTDGSTGWSIVTSGLQSSSGSVVLNGTTGEITGATVTGGTVQTSSGAYSMIMNGSSNALQFKVAGFVSGNVLPLGTAGILMHYGSTPDQTGSTYPKVQLSFAAALLQGSASYYVQSTNSGNSALGNFRMFDGLQVDGSSTFNGTMFAPNLSTTSLQANLRVATGAIGEISELTASSIRFKENIVPINNIVEISPDKLLDIPVRSFTYKESYLSESDQRFSLNLPGFIAEEIAEAYPIAVDYANGEPYSWNERFIIPGMLALIQKLNQELISVKSRLDALEG